MCRSCSPWKANASVTAFLAATIVFRTGISANSGDATRPAATFSSSSLVAAPKRRVSSAVISITADSTGTPTREVSKPACTGTFT